MRRAIIMSAIVLSALLTGCSFEVSSKPSDASSSSPTVDDGGDSKLDDPCGEECSNQEVADTGCDSGNPTTAGKPFEVSPSDLAGVSGVLELRKADPIFCDNIYWARFRPYTETSDESWVVTIVTDGFPREEQPSVPGDPTVDGYTEGVYVGPGQTVTYCLAVGKAGACEKFVSPS